MDQLLALIVDESKWLTASLSLAFLVVTILFTRNRFSDYSRQIRTESLMNLFFGITIGTMAFGHLLAVSIKLGQGTLEGSIALFYGIGILLAAPSWWLIYHTFKRLHSVTNSDRKIVILNAWLGITLLGLGIHNLPLAVPSILNIGYHLHSNRIVGWAIVSLAVVINLALLIGSLVFLASGQSFEQFRGIE